MNHQNIKKWSNSSKSAVVLQKTHGMPFYRLSKLQGLSGVPVAYSTLWQSYLDIWKEGGGKEIFGELLGMIAECDWLNLDDTNARILEVISENKSLKAEGKKGRSCYSTTICGKTADGDKIAVYITKNRHCGENIGKVLKTREDRDSKIHLMVDASNNNNPVLGKDEQELIDNIIIIKCLAHGQRKFTDNLEYYPEECKYFLEQTEGIYHNEHHCKEKGLSLEEKLVYHKEHSTKHIDNIYNKIEELFNKKLVEPNSALGQAMRYWKKHKEGLTQFLRIPVLSLDNNLAERALKSIILQRKNSLFFRTLNSAEIHSGMHSIVRTCQENGINALMYLNWMQDNSAKLKKSPKEYTPFAYAKLQKSINATELIKVA